MSDLSKFKVKVGPTQDTDDGYAYNATLYLGSKKVGTARQDGHGGMLTYRWDDRGLGDAIEAAIHRVSDKCYADYIEDLCEAALTAKFMAKHFKRGLCWRMPEDGQNFRASRIQDTPANREWVIRTYPDAVILNPAP